MKKLQEDLIVMKVKRKTIAKCRHVFYNAHSFTIAKQSEVATKPIKMDFHTEKHCHICNSVQSILSCVTSVEIKDVLCEGQRESELLQLSLFDDLEPVNKKTQ